MAANMDEEITKLSAKMKRIETWLLEARVQAARNILTEQQIETIGLMENELFNFRQCLKELLELIEPQITPPAEAQIENAPPLPPPPSTDEKLAVAEVKIQELRDLLVRHEETIDELKRDYKNVQKKLLCSEDERLRLEEGDMSNNPAAKAYLPADISDMSQAEDNTPTPRHS